MCIYPFINDIIHKFRNLHVYQDDRFYKKSKQNEQLRKRECFYTEMDLLVLYDNIFCVCDI
ncbi:hypothetical protein BCV72DRAFT_232755 [Rhizopus microsporus var. microsporus]|uniref:Uncharacterized protein n=1 Tax=Rhizopus microsporus var. microsporus TaxID=86635 RepID=A0A1X0QV33_RHIZD|nr:hypothetical protein BCV72DRAFT_232755 [Rhizopus microsporus var. microsporus]